MSAIKGYRRLQEAELQGERRLNRPRWENQDRRKLKKWSSKSSWYKRKNKSYKEKSQGKKRKPAEVTSKEHSADIEAVMFGPATLGGELQAGM